MRTRLVRETLHGSPADPCTDPSLNSQPWRTARPVKRLRRLNALRPHLAQALARMLVLVLVLVA